MASRSDGYWYRICKEENLDILRPALLGAWNVRSPDYITQESIAFYNSARRYEPGVLNASGIVGLKEVLLMIKEIGLKRFQTDFYH